MPELSPAAIEAVASVIRCGLPHDGSDHDEAVDQDAERALAAALPHLLGALVEEARSGDEWVSAHDLLVRIGALVWERTR